MTREEIEYASKDYVNYLLDKQEYHNENYTEDDIRQAFEKGAMLANNNPDTSSLWHDASEEPGDKDLKILLETKSGCYWVGSRCIASFFCDNWQKYAEDVALTRWAYINDLIPKGGKEL